MLFGRLSGNFIPSNAKLSTYIPLPSYLFSQYKLIKVPRYHPHIVFGIKLVFLAPRNPTSDTSFLSPPMETHAYAAQNTSQRGVAMVLALVSAAVLSPLYVDRKSEYRHETKWSSGFVLPVILAGLIVAIKTTSSSSMQRGNRGSLFPSPEPSSVLRIGNSSWGLAGVLVMLICVLSWQSSVQQFFWR